MQLELVDAPKDPPGLVLAEASDFRIHGLWVLEPQGLSQDFIFIGRVVTWRTPRRCKEGAGLGLTVCNSNRVFWESIDQRKVFREQL